MSKYKPGQEWSYKTRPGEESSRLTILKVEPHEKLGNVVHIRVSDVKLRSATAPDGVVSVIEHAPYVEEAIDESAVELMAEDVELPDFAAGYEAWKTAFEKGEAGVFTLPVDKGVEVTEQVLSHGM
jgi:hypothetical protein